MTDPRQFAPATTRNRDAILAVLARPSILGAVSAEGARVLEIASGSGEHAVFFTEHLANVAWQPSDPSAEARESVDAWCQFSGVENVAPALELDVERRPWPFQAKFDLIFCANMIHIAPWSAGQALLAEAPRHLAPGGVLFLYGPYKRGGAHTAPSNEAFDRSLRARDARWGVRELEDVVDVARAHGLVLEDVVEMPANNLSVVFRRAAGP